MEIIDVYDRHRNKVRTAERRDKLGENEYRLVVHICAFNSKGELLIQKRLSFKHGWPGLWDLTTGGAASTGETSAEAAARELKEELGIEYDFGNMRPVVSVSFASGFDDYYIIEKEIDPDELQLQYEEVEKAEWASEEKVLSMIDDGVFIPYHKGFIEMLFDMRKNFGTIIIH
ncbi:MAG: NUDIX domain-containing protein [Oscillospiraceae bacterium]|nr:NUDIX domain-containing protein [Oscillospiraceae bacterium]